MHFSRSINEAVKKAFCLCYSRNVLYPKKHNHVAVALYKHRIVSIAHNDYNVSSALQRLYAKKVGKKDCVYNHAEVSAINKADGKVDTIVVLRTNNKDELLFSEPCVICRELLKDFGVKRVIHSIKGGLTCVRI